MGEFIKSLPVVLGTGHGTRDRGTTLLYVFSLHSLHLLCQAEERGEKYQINQAIVGHFQEFFFGPF